MIDAYWSAGARDACEGHSVFAARGGGTRIGERLAARRVHLFSDPAHPGLECAPFVVARRRRAASVFDNGLPLGRTDWIRDGELTSLLQTRHSRGDDRPPVTPAIDNLVLARRRSARSTSWSPAPSAVCC